MLNVSYKNKIGHYTMTQTNADGTYKYRIDICHANALCAMMYFFTNSEGEKEVRLMSFFSGLTHAKNCIKNNVLDGCDNFVFKAKECNAEIWKLIQLLANNGKKVTIK